MKRYITVMRVICHILLTELSYAVLPGKAIETVCSERAGNKLVKLALWSTHLFVWLLNKCLLTMSMKQLGIGRMVMSLEYTDQKNFSWNSNPLNRFMKSPGDILGDSEGQGSLACCSPWGRKELGMTERLNWTEPVERLTNAQKSWRDELDVCAPRLV